MCRFAFYLGSPIRLGSLVTEPAHSLIHQSFHAHERDEPLNGDGFGVAWYEPALSDEPAVFRAVTPAWSNRNLHELARVVMSSCILTHVRAATQALEVSEANCHPFKRGRYAFMHNGDIGGFARLRRPLVSRLSDESFAAISGSTDSEHLFALFLDELHKLGPDEVGPDVLALAFRSTVAMILDMVSIYAPDEHCYLNVVITDGSVAIACRFTTDLPEHSDSLYLNYGMRYVCDEGVCRMILPEDSHGAVLISSEPLSTDPGWNEVPLNHVVKIHRNRKVAIEPFDPTLPSPSVRLDPRVPLRRTP